MRWFYTQYMLIKTLQHLCFSSVEDAQGDNKISNKYRARIAGHCPAIDKVMSELAESLQARQQRTLSSAKYVNFAEFISSLFTACVLEVADY